MVIERIRARIPASVLQRWRVGLCVLVAVGALAAAGVGLRRVHAQSTPSASAAEPQNAATADEKPGAAAENPPTSAAAPVAKPSEASSPEQQRKQEVANECANLLKMATDLKTEVDKTTKDELSIAVVRKAGELEQFAHKVRGDTRLTAGKD
jgi:hypothetical protein